VDAEIRAEVASQVPEAMVQVWEGWVPEGVDALLVGPGGVTEIPAWQGPLVLDASALLQGEGPRWMQRPWTVITPHPGEFARLFHLAQPLPMEASGRLAHLRSVATGPGIVVLKGAQSLLGGGSQPTVLANPTGHPGLSTGGTGDFLAGMVSARVALTKKRGGDLEALREAVAETLWLHGAAADRLGGGPLLVRDLGPSLTLLLKELHGHER
jgi:NAD(P)H-hydrate repair Nnr-like enzyme with NAD(P)H-hydrate dehydratase domain